jgi:hypothetical protein
MEPIRPHGAQRRLLLLALVVVAGVVAAACSTLAGLAPPATATPCALAFSEARCTAIRVSVARALGVDPGEISTMEILPAPTPERAEDGRMIGNLSGGPPPEVAVALADGSAHRVTLPCGGIASGYVPACMDEPALRPSSATMGGYRDVPCAGEPPDGCATPQPPSEAEAVAEATPIEVAALDVPVDRTGPYEVLVGTGSLANGILSEASFALAEPWPEGIVMLEGSVFLDVRSREPDGRPFDNYYLHGWREGVERIEAFLVFDVDHVEPGGTLRIRDLVVR